MELRRRWWHEYRERPGLIALIPAVWAVRRVPEQTAPPAGTGRLGFGALAPTFVWYVLFGAGYVAYMTFIVALLAAQGLSNGAPAARPRRAHGAHGDRASLTRTPRPVSDNRAPAVGCGDFQPLFRFVGDSFQLGRPDLVPQ